MYHIDTPGTRRLKNLNNYIGRQGGTIIDIMIELFGKFLFFQNTHHVNNMLMEQKNTQYIHVVETYQLNYKEYAAINVLSILSIISLMSFCGTLANSVESDHTQNVASDQGF